MVQPPGQPRILGLYSHGGAGHLSALQSVIATLGSAYRVTPLAPLRDLCVDLDPCSWLSGRRYDGEDLYNALAARGQVRLQSLLAAAGTWAFPLRRAGIVRRLSAHVGAARPDLILSTMPFINAAVLEVAQAYDVPFLVVACDLDLRYYVRGLHRPPVDRFRITLPFAEPSLRQPLQAAGLTPAQQVHVGFPLRPALAQPVTAAQMQAWRAAAHMPQDRPVLVLMMGGAGSNLAEAYVRTLLRLPEALHLVVLTGRNAALHRRLSALRPSGPVSLMPVGFTAEVHRLLGAADVLLTKPGATSVMEGMSLGIPMLLDCTRGIISWERANVRFAEQHQAAEAVHHLADLPAMLRRALARPRRFAATAPFVDFAARLPQVVAALLNAPGHRHVPAETFAKDPSHVSLLTLSGAAGDLERSDYRA